MSRRFISKLHSHQGRDLKDHATLPDQPVGSASRSDAKPAAHQFDLGGISDTIQRALAAAGLDSQSGPLRGVTDTIRKALAGAGLAQRGPSADVEAHGGEGQVIDGVATRIPTPGAVAPDDAPAPADARGHARTGEFVTRTHTNGAGTRTYKLYVPARASGAGAEPRALVVMLHGCTQSPDDFAAGTRMNALADEHGFLVVYPAQSADANASRCWNWFRGTDQVRDGGEPSLLAGIVHAVVAAHDLDARRIFVAGMSAGGAMAVVLGATYPDLFAAVGVHSGLPYGAAHDMASAMGAMQGASAGRGLPGAAGIGGARAPKAGSGVPTIVFHGDRDYTVNARNGAAIVEQTTAGRLDKSGLRVDVRAGLQAGGRTFRRTVYTDASSTPVIEEWLITGAGHAWSGGNPSGSYTDPRGPDASAEMVRFFLAQPRAGAA